MRHYCRPDCGQFRAALIGALPGILTRSAVAKVKPVEDLATLAGMVVAGTVTDVDKKRLRVLTAKV